jgi:CubicO group peptidase (beta-lactamase class C family)
MRIGLRVRNAVLLLLCLFAPALAVAGAPPAAVGPPQLTAEDLSAFLGGMIPYAISQANIAGAAVAVVANGQLVFAEGYGFADTKSRRPVIADQTLFRAGSVSKLFTWTAVMQLVEQGKLDLDANINDYLDFKVPEPYGRPITLRDLMTHSAGFEETVTDLFVNKPSQLFPLRQYLIRHMPPLIYPPGQVVAYSNYGATLAGYIVQRVSGEPFDEYVMRHILQPLGMDHSTFQQPLPANLRPLLASGYPQASSDDAAPFELVEAAPAGALTTDVTDLAKFMLAQLDGGSYSGGAQILSAATVAEMHTPQGRPLPGMNGMDLGFYDENRNGRRIIGHGGDTSVFHSDLHLLLDKGVGFVIMLNSTGNAGAAEAVRVAIFRRFLDRYFPYTPPREATVSDPGKDAARVAGFYGSSRHTALRILNAVGQSAVTAERNGQIEASELTHLSGVPKRWREVGPLTWREVGGQAHLEFVAGKTGKIKYWLSDDTIPVDINLPVHGLGQSSLLKSLGGLFLIVMLLTVGIWIGGAIIRRRFQHPLALPPRKAALRLASRIGVVIYLLLIVGWLAFFAGLSTAALVGGELLGRLIPLYVLGVLAILGSLAMIANAGLRLRLGPGGILARGGELLLGLAGIYGVWGVIHLGLASFTVSF